MTQQEKEKLLEFVKAMPVNAAENCDNSRVVAVTDVIVWLRKWKGYIDEDIIQRMVYRVCDIPTAVKGGE